ncbi:pyridoxamine 5'-phosphate oxidase [Synechococcus sp. RSCCF101]|uniref:pyridoxamine 5'-phosphate oxidase family protein n=1 Tax=Synechococcus sp. RSCCF101 TaxID=2511069 RepID=UPI0012466BE1|nr:pyridoxamine 5'-phosphate oxidase family protein [Synechococcus sp. RSCCF101]QEY32075.1 pyridoxamine 5'-phosphate oxidase [Synechococcus sp. RSCCF101]
MNDPDRPSAHSGQPSLPPWRPLLRAARQQEGRSPAARWLQLASVAADGTPRVRTLVARGWAGPAQLDLLTDGRSAKAAELQAQPAVEVCWLLPKARRQFRLRGRVAELEPERRRREENRHWLALRPAGRALWGWPQPGAARESDALFPAELADDSPIPASFLLLRLEIERAELLDLRDHPHRRSLWRLEQGWREEPLNP